MVDTSFPRAIMTASDDEIEIVLNVTAGKLPDDLGGHVFMIAPVGSVNSDGLPNPSGTHIWNGNGMIYRLDFERPEQVALTSRLVKSPCYYADEATQPGSSYSQYQFNDYGMARFSVELGMRNQLNTALIPMQFSESESERLLITFDGGRPYEIDPVTLKLVTPLGANTEWRPGINLNFPFPPVLGTAHPAFDARTQELFTVNYGRSFANFSETIPFAYQLRQWLSKLGVGGFSQALDRFLDSLSGTEDFVYLIRWDGSGDLERWKLILADGSPVTIQQTMHQIAVSQDYVILIDSCLKFGLGQLLNNPLLDNAIIARTLKWFVSKPQLPDTSIYIVPRKYLRKGQYPAKEQQELEVVAHKVVIPLETAHFLVDYAHPKQQITLHMAHQCANDVSEWLQKSDRSVYDSDEGISPDLAGMIAVGAMDVGRLGRYVIDVPQAKVMDSKVIHHPDYTWALSLYTYRDRLASGLPPAKITNLYWHSFGFWSELFTKFTYELYQDYPHRIMSVEEVLNLKETKTPRPCLFRLDTTAMEIADFYEFPPGHLINSPQFIPRKASTEEDESTSGYIICAVISSKSKELWLFDAQALSKGAICQLGHEQLNFGYTVHTAWLPQIKPRTASYQIPVRQDYEALVNQKSAKVRELFEQEIYPHFPETRKNRS
ncbi:MAG TPA: carotenoid oxygenase family protein [Xenococcaceae cyanobacterium]